MSRPNPGDVALAKTVIYETTRANRERTPRGCFKRERTEMTDVTVEKALMDLYRSVTITWLFESRKLEAAVPVDYERIKELLRVVLDATEAAAMDPQKS